MVKVKIHPKTKRAKNRVREHGDVMTFIKANPDGSVLVESLGNTCQGEKYWGWFKKEEADICEIEVGES